MNWKQFTENTYYNPGLDFTLDYSLMGLEVAFFQKMEPRMQEAFSAMQALEGGAIANPDEERMVGHYWLRAPHKAPTSELKAEIENCLSRIEEFTAAVHRGEIAGEGGSFEHLLVIGIGGSALGPQFVSHALGQPGEDRLQVHFFDNTDPDGIDLTLAHLRGKLNRTLAVVISKSGGTPETRNGMLEATQAFLTEGIEFAKQAIAITGENSKLDQLAIEEGWLARFPMWDWVGGRTSVLAAVGLLPAALQGFPIRDLLNGAAAMDTLTIEPETRTNPAALLALCWYHATNGKGEKDMVILPYKDRLALFSKYLQQLIMESLGKEKNLQGEVVHQGIAVYGNKGSTDQHAYVQQLREGVSNFFATFIEVKKDREGASIEVEPGTTSGDFLHAFLLGTREALVENDRASISITIDQLNAKSVGLLIALYERTVGIYAALIESMPTISQESRPVKKLLPDFLTCRPGCSNSSAMIKGTFYSIPDLAKALKAENQAVTIYKILEHALHNPSKGVERKLINKPFDSMYRIV